MATARRAPTEFVNVPGNGLDAFETEISAPPSTPVPSPLLEIVSAYPEPELCPAAWRTPPRQPFSLRRLMAATLSAVRAVVIFPFVVLSWCILRISWLIRLALLGVWRVITRTLQLIANAFAATGRGIRDVIVGAVQHLIGAVAAIASAVRAVAFAIRRAIGVAGALVARAAVAIVVAAKLVAQQVAYAFSATGRGIRDVIVGAVQHLIGAVTAIASAVRAVVTAGGRALIGGAAMIRSAIVTNARHTREAGGWLRARLRHDGPPVVTLAVAGSPAWARLPIVAVLAAACSATAAIAVGIVLLSQPQAQRVAASASDAPVPVAPTGPIVTTASIVMPVALSAPDPGTPAAGPRAPAVSVSALSNAPQPEAARALSPARVRALWSETDTRSLDRALSALRSATLAFERCEMRVTSDDRAVAHCDEAGLGRTAMRVAWTIDFHRNDGRWLIDELSATRRLR